MPENPQLQLAHQFVEKTNKHIFLTGKAGTGKTTFLHSIKEKSPKRMVVVAPTGVAAINAGGVTIHSFFQMPFGPHLPKEALQGNENKYASGYAKLNKTKINIIRSLDLLVIDEISMVRADLLDGIDEILRRYRYKDKPFGGVQLLMIGDIRQLSPIIKDDERNLLQPYYNTFYFFGSRALRQTDYISIELQHVYRQSDTHFISLLNKVRDSSLDNDTIDELNKRYLPDFANQNNEGYIQLTTHNNKADAVNQKKLKELTTDSYEFTAYIEGDFPEYIYPTDVNLTLKRGAQVMFVKNDPNAEKEFYNGKIGVVEQIDEIEEIITVKCPEDGSKIHVGRLTWENTKYSLNPETKEIKEDIVGRYEQIPLKLAWTITIHKSQGLTFDKAIIDARESFAHGQVYVALSRCRTLEGMVLSSSLSSTSVKSDAGVTQFSKQMEENHPDDNTLHSAEIDFHKDLLEELFNFKLISYYVSNLRKELSKYANYDLLAGVLSLIETIQKDLSVDIFDVAEKFKRQLQAFYPEMHQPEGKDKLYDRLKQAAGYFREKVDSILYSKLSSLAIETDNKQIKQDIKKINDKLLNELVIKQACFDVCLNGFVLQEFLDARAKATIEQTKKAPKPAEEELQYADIAHPQLYNALRSWRNLMAEEEGMPVYRIIQQKAMLGIADKLPSNTKELVKIKGIGKKMITQNGPAILKIVEEYCKEKEIDYNADYTIQFEEKTKKPKVDTKKLTFDLFKQGKSIEEIANDRGFSATTIEGHLAHFIENGELSIDTFLKKDEVEEIYKAIVKTKTQNLTPLKEALNHKYDYGKLRMVVAHYKLTTQ